MTIRERTQRHDAATRQARQAYLERLYNQGWKPPREPSYFWDAAEVVFGLIATLAVLMLAVQWIGL